MTALNPNPPQSTLLPVCNLLEPGVYERRRWKTLRVEDEFLDPFLAEKQLEDQRVMVAKNRNPQADRLTAAETVRSKSFDAPRCDARNAPRAFQARLLAEVCKQVLGPNGGKKGNSTKIASAVAKALEQGGRDAKASTISPTWSLAEKQLDMIGGSKSVDRLGAAKSLTSLYSRGTLGSGIEKGGSVDVRHLDAAEVPGLAPYRSQVETCVEIKLFNHTFNFIESEWIWKQNLSKLRDLDQRGTVVQKSAESTSI